MEKPATKKFTPTKTGEEEENTEKPQGKSK